MRKCTPLLVCAGAVAAVIGFRVERAVAAPLNPNNILVTTENFGTSGADTVREYTPTGTLVQTFAVPYGSGSRPVTEDVRDAIVDPSGLVRIYNGTFSPFLTTLTPSTSSFTHDAGVGFSSVANVSFGGIAARGNFVYVSDMSTGGSADSGIVRFDTVTATSARFANGAEFQDINIGLDGRLYGIVSPGGGVNSSQIFVYDPTTMAQTGTINLAGALVTADLRGIAADASGTLYGAAWDGNLYRISSTGAVLGSVPTGTTNLTDIDLSPTGALIAGGRFGNVIISNTSLTSPTSFLADSVPVHVAFAAAVPEPASGAVILGTIAMAATMAPRRRGRTR